MSSILIGASGLLGSHLSLFELGTLWRPSSNKLDITDKDSIDDYLFEIISKHNQEIDHIILCAAYTNVAKANIEKDKAYNVNVLGVSNIIKALYKSFFYDSLPILTYISTDYVFKGDKGNYRITDPLDPVPNNYYATTKALGEAIVRTYPKRQIIRTSFCRSDLWPFPMAFEDQYTSRDTVDVIAPMIDKLITSKQLGTFHIGTERKSVYELAKKINPSVQSGYRGDIKGVHIPYDTSLEIYDGTYI